MSKKKESSKTAPGKSKKTTKGKTKEPQRNTQSIKKMPSVVPVLATSELVAFPSVMMSLYIVDEKNRNGVIEAEKSENMILIVAANKPVGESFKTKDLPDVGVIAQISRVLNLNDGRIKVLLQGLVRVKIKGYKANKKLITAQVQVAKIKPLKITAEVRKTVALIRERLQVMVELELLPEEILLVTEEIKDPAMLADIIIAHYKLDVQYAQNLLEEFDPEKRLKLTAKIIEDDYNSFVVAENIRQKTQTELSKGQKDYFLREQLKQIRKELGDDDSSTEDLAEIKHLLQKAKLPKEAKKETDRQLKRLDRMPMESSEYAMIRTYLEWMADLPWSKRTKEKLDLNYAQDILDQDHYGLAKAKDRILEFLSVKKLNKKSKGPIICFLGPPGVGKTSLGRSVAKALNREFVRVSLGGVRDEAEIRGHRRTYVGALPGRIIQGLKTAGTTNPVFMLDELDKIGADYRGDPSSALLEILDPQQNSDFSDHYINVPYDLSECMFVATANNLDTIPEPLMDRLEIISIPGYTTDEKLNIAKKYLVPRQLETNGLNEAKLKLSDQTLTFIIERYTREAGVRGLEREIASVFRKVARQYVEDKKVKKELKAADIEKLLGPTQFDPDFSGREDQIGLANGLAWTMHGGEIMPVEVQVAPGKGDLNLTGQLGSVLQESAQAAVFYARANYKELALDPKFHEKLDIHIHLPEGATPKDGPSAGVTLISALVSVLSGRKIRSDLAMTGEITLRGNVLPIGGLKEKALAALRYGITDIIIPFANQKDIVEIPKAQQKLLNFIPVKTIDEVLAVTLHKPQKKPVRKSAKKSPQKSPKKKTTSAAAKKPVKKKSTGNRKSTTL